MDTETRLMDRIKRFEDLKNQITEITKKINGLTEQRIAVYNQALELKGAIDVLVEEKQDLAKSKTAGLTLPVGVQPVIPTDVSVVAETAPTESVALEVK